MSKTTASRVAFIALAGVGAAIWLFSVVLHFVGFFTGRSYELDHSVMLVGTLFGFIGFFGLDSKRAKEGASFAVDQSVKMIKAVPRFGRRASDAVAVPSVETTVTAVPTQEPAIETTPVPTDLPTKRDD